MSEVIYKFKRGVLRGQKLHVNRDRHQRSYPKHWHSYYELIYYRDCTGRCILNGKPYPITENSLFLLTPKDFHEIIMEDQYGPESFVISFSEQIIDNSVFSKISSGPIYVQKLPEWTGQQIQRLHKLFTGRSENRQDYLYHLFNCILIELLELNSGLAHGAGDISPMIRESISLMLCDPGGQYSLELFSKRFNVGTTYFSRLFHASTGVTFKAYLSDLRIEYAKRLLEEKTLPIIDVGCECGYNTPSQFIRSFKQHTGMTPSAYRTQALRE